MTGQRPSLRWAPSRYSQPVYNTFITPPQAVVILAANVGFLAIQSIDQVDENDNPVRDRSVGQIVSYISTIFSIGNILACTILARPHRPSMLHYAEDAVRNNRLSHTDEVGVDGVPLRCRPTT